MLHSEQNEFKDFFVNVVEKMDIQGSLGITDKDIDMTLDFKEGE